jgi:hypothetical protein
MHLLQAGVDISVIALWLGHASIETTHIYVEADLAMQERALSALQAPSIKPLRFRPTQDRICSPFWRDCDLDYARLTPSAGSVEPDIKGTWQPRAYKAGESCA